MWSVLLSSRRGLELLIVYKEIKLMHAFVTLLWQLLRIYARIIFKRKKTNYIILADCPIFKVLTVYIFG